MGGGKREFPYPSIVMSQDNLIGLECTVCKRVTYFSYKNKKNNTERLELKKYCKWDRKHTLHKETKVGKGK